ncbi:MAG: hypothetical protein AAFR22_07170, partial [Chloroflexota bacterium]
TPRTPYRPLVWTDAVLDIQELLLGFADPVYIVGGAVRDALLGRPIKDLDLATPGDSIGVAKLIANSFPNGALYIMDKERGVARALIETMHGPLNVDVAKFRGEAGDLLTDVTDRDFTINAMMVDLKGDLAQIIDPLNGERDVAQKTIRRCNPQSVVSDPVRGLRAVRQSNQLTYRIEPETLKDVRTSAAHLDDTSPERVRDELFKIHDLRRPAAALRVMQRIGLLDAVLPVTENSGQDGVEQIFAVQDKLAGLLAGFFPGEMDNLASDFGYGLALVQVNRVRMQLEDYLRGTMWASQRTHRSLVMVMPLFYDFSLDDVAAHAERLRLSSDEKKRLVAVMANRRFVFEMRDTEPLTLHRFWFGVGEAGVDVCLFAMADYLAQQGVELRQNAWLVIIERVQALLEAYYLHHDEIVSPPPLLTGNDLMDTLGLPPGKHIGQLITVLREAQVTGEVKTVDDALNYARAALGDDARGDIRR